MLNKSRSKLSSDFLQMRQDLLQRAAISSLLFNIIINDIVRTIQLIIEWNVCMVQCSRVQKVSSKSLNTMTEPIKEGDCHGIEKVKHLANQSYRCFKETEESRRYQMGDFLWMFQRKIRNLGKSMEYGQELIVTDSVKCNYHPY